MLDRETWRFINTFAPWVSAVGTLLAVIVSLRLAARSARVRLHVSTAIYRLAAPGERFADAPEYLQIRAVNHGHRDATVNGLMWSYRPLFGKRRTVAQIPPTDPKSSRLPIKLAFGDAARCFFTMGEFKAGVADFLDMLRQARFPKLAVRRLKAGVYTTTGQEFVRPIDKTVRDALLKWMSEPAAQEHS